MEGQGSGLKKYINPTVSMANPSVSLRSPLCRPGSTLLRRLLLLKLAAKGSLPANWDEVG